MAKSVVGSQAPFDEIRDLEHNGFIMLDNVMVCAPIFQCYVIYVRILIGKLFLNVTLQHKCFYFMFYLK